jgi:hypothetical protein
VRGNSRRLFNWSTTAVLLLSVAAVGYVAVTRATEEDEIDPAKQDTLDRGPQPATPTPVLPPPASEDEDAALAELHILGAPGDVAAAAKAGDIEWLLDHTARTERQCTGAGSSHSDAISCADAGLAEGTVAPMINIGDILDFYVTEAYVRPFLGAALDGGNAPLVFAGRESIQTLIAFAPEEPKPLDGWDFDVAGVAFTTEFEGGTPIVKIQALAPHFGPQQMFQRDFTSPDRSVIYNDEERSPGLMEDAAQESLPSPGP